MTRSAPASPPRSLSTKLMLAALACGILAGPSAPARARFGNQPFIPPVTSQPSFGDHVTLPPPAPPLFGNHPRFGG